MNDNDGKSALFLISTLVCDIEVYDYTSGKLLHTFCGTDPCCNNQQFTLDIEYPNFILENADFEVVWCSKVNKGKQIAMCNYVNNSGVKVYKEDVITDIIKDLDNVLQKLYNISDNVQYNTILKIKENYQKVLKNLKTN